MWCNKEGDSLSGLGNQALDDCLAAGCNVVARESAGSLLANGTLQCEIPVQPI